MAPFHAFLLAMLSSQTPPKPVQVEEKPLPAPVAQHDTEAEKQLIREVRPGYAGEQAGRAPRKGRLLLPQASETQRPQDSTHSPPLGLRPRSSLCT